MLLLLLLLLFRGVVTTATSATEALVLMDCDMVTRDCYNMNEKVLNP